MSFVKNFKSNVDRNLEIKMDERLLQERAHRIRLLRPSDLVCRIQLAPKDGDLGETFEIRVKNVSESGLAFVGTLPSMKIADQAEVFFVAGGESLASKIEIVRQDKELTGAKVCGDPQPWAGFLRRHFKIELEAASLHAVDPAILQKKKGREILWFFSPHGRELHVTTLEQNVTEFHLVFEGHHFQSTLLNGKPGFLYGQVLDDQNELGVKIAHQIVPTTRPAPLEVARRFVANIEGLPENHLKQILTFLKAP